MNADVPFVKDGAAAIAVLALRRARTAQAAVVDALALLERGVVDVALELDIRRGLGERDRLRLGFGVGTGGD